MNALILRVAALKPPFVKPLPATQQESIVTRFRAKVMETTVSPVKTTEFKEIYVKNGNCAWCRLLWQENGWVVILSDYGHWAYWWGHRGQGVSVAKFLAGLDRDYMGNKMMGQALMEFSLESTVQAIRETIISDRKSCGMEKEEARNEWELALQLEAGDLSFDAWYGESSMVDGYECRRTEVCGTWDSFWKNLWLPLVVPVLKSEYE